MARYKFTGFFSDKFFDCEAETEEEAQQKMKTQLIEYLNQEKEPFIVWVESEIETNQKEGG